MKFWWTKKKCALHGAQCSKNQCGEKCWLLSDITPGSCVCVKRHNSCGAVRQRLLDLGITPCAKVNVVNKAPLGGPIQLRVGESNLILSKSEADQIEVDIVMP
ncbi:MAG: ferrous iron transport protein A [Proteobacteria bacterium]|nr:ferrous iron transport protein A [Pseudomonadota bacterium]MBU4296998.1 ferrous iron transport protein A [Pseudomonadota bacterium]MCG2749879.1 ferrous iron transport protein A [Desulfobulbaceae bacterium]